MSAYDWLRALSIAELRRAPVFGYGFARLEAEAPAGEREQLDALVTVGEFLDWGLVHLVSLCGEGPPWTYAAALTLVLQMLGEEPLPLWPDPPEAIADCCAVPALVATAVTVRGKPLAAAAVCRCCLTWHVRDWEAFRPVAEPALDEGLGLLIPPRKAETGTR